MWIIKCKDGKEQHITIPEKAREAWEYLFNEKIVTHEFITGLAIKLEGFPLVTISKPNIDRPIRWFIEKIAIAQRAASDTGKEASVIATDIGEVIGYQIDNIITKTYVYYSNGLVNQTISLL